MIIRSFNVDVDQEKARLGVMLAAEALGIKCDCRLQTMWRVDIDGGDFATFLEFARDCADRGK